MFEQLISLSFAIIAVPVFLVSWSVVNHNIRIRLAKQAFRKLPSGARERILSSIDAAAERNTACALLVPVASHSGESDSEAIASSRFGGTPYSEAADTWPRLGEGASEPADFLIQVRLDQPLPAPWIGRLIVVFRKSDIQQTVRVYESTSAERAVALNEGSLASFSCRLCPIRIPAPPLQPDGTDSPFVAYDPPTLLDSVPGLNDELTAFSNRPADLLTQILAPEHYTYGLGLEDVVQMGGRPEWLQAADEQACEHCGQPLRFLFQFGDLSQRSRLGDAGICYVFGCDNHPTIARAVVQMC